MYVLTYIVCYKLRLSVNCLPESSAAVLSLSFTPVLAEFKRSIALRPSRKGKMRQRFRKDSRQSGSARSKAIIIFYFSWVKDRYRESKESVALPE